VCGFDAAAIVRADSTLRLRDRHKALYAALLSSFGVFGSHPSQRTLAEAIGALQQQITRDVKRLELAGLIAVVPGAYRAGERRHGANTYHFRRHHLFVDEFAHRNSRVSNRLADFSQHFQENSVPTVEIRPINESIQRDTVTLTSRSVVIEPLTACGRVELYYVIRYVECVTKCGGCRIEYSDGTVKKYECSCGDLPAVLEVAA
jgi:hypothetical protein